MADGGEGMGIDRYNIRRLWQYFGIRAVRRGYIRYYSFMVCSITTRTFTFLDESEVSQSLIYLCSTLSAPRPGDRKTAHNPCSVGDNPYRRQ